MGRRRERVEVGRGRKRGGGRAIGEGGGGKRGERRWEEVGGEGRREVMGEGGTALTPGPGEDRFCSAFSRSAAGVPLSAKPQVSILFL